MGIVYWAVMGLLIGIVARIIMPGRDRGGLIMTILLGIGGAILGGFIASRLGWGGIQAFNLRGFMVAVGGSLILLLLYRLFRR